MPKRFAEIKQNIKNSNDLIIPRGQLQIPRHQMPQIAFDDYEEYFMLMDLRGVKVERGLAIAKNLRAAQSEINTEKVKSWMRSMLPMAAKKPLLISSDNYVLDGNHRWLAILNRDPNEFIDCYRIGLNIEDLLNTSRLFYKATNKTIAEEIHAI